MAAKTTAHDDQRKDGQIVAYKMAASETIYKGSTSVLSSGYAQTNDWTTNTLANGDVFAGICVETKTNAGSAGDEYVRVYTDWNVIVDVVDTITQANVGDEVYINNVSDDWAVTITSDTGNPQVTVGQIVEFISANKARIAIRNYVGNIAAAA